MVAEFESDLIRLRTGEGIRIAKAKGRLRGKQPKLNSRQEAHLVALFKSGEYSTAELGDLFDVARSTVYRAIERDNARQRAERHQRWRQPAEASAAGRRGRTGQGRFTGLDRGDR